MRNGRVMRQAFPQARRKSRSSVRSAEATSLTQPSSRGLRIDSSASSSDPDAKSPIPEPRMRRIKLWPAILPFLLAQAWAPDEWGRRRPRKDQVFIIAAADGYGVEDCLAEAANAAASSPTPGARRTATAPRCRSASPRTSPARSPDGGRDKARSPYSFAAATRFALAR